MAALALIAGLTTMVATDAGAASSLAWCDVGLTVAVLGVSLVVRSEAALVASLGVAGLGLLLRVDDRLVLAPVYGALLLVTAELARTCQELGSVEGVAPRVIRARLMAAGGWAGLGACAATVVSLAATAGPPRSAATSLAATTAIAAAFATVVVIARGSRARVRGRAGRSRAPNGNKARNRGGLDDERERDHGPE